MRPRPTSLLLFLLLAGAGVETSAAHAQTKTPAQDRASAPMVYEREVFRYDRGGRPDPFRSLLTAEELGYRVEDMRLTGIIYSPDPRRSVTVLSDVVSKKRFRLKVGERVGGIVVAAIRPREVDLVINEFGVIRRETLVLKRPELPQQPEEGESAPPPLPIGERSRPEAQNGRGS